MDDQSMRQIIHPYPAWRKCHCMNLTNKSTHIAIWDYTITMGSQCWFPRAYDCYLTNVISLMTGGQGFPGATGPQGPHGEKGKYCHT